MADAPQTAVPTPTIVSTSPRNPSSRPASQAIARAVTKVPTSTGNDLPPIESTWLSESPVPNMTIEALSTFFELNAIPGCNLTERFLTDERAIPQTIAMTGAPTTGAKPPSAVATAATAAVMPTPGPSSATR